MDQARRDLVLLAPRGRPEPTGTFALRAPTRPNPIASSIVALVERQGGTLLVRGLDCLRRHAAARHQALARPGLARAGRISRRPQSAA